MSWCFFAEGIGTKVDWDKAFVCLREAAERGNVYAMGNLVAYYYKRKLMTKAVELAARFAILSQITISTCTLVAKTVSLFFSSVSLFEDVNQIAYETECVPSFVAKGIAMACFFYARCLQLGLGVKKNVEECKTYYSRVRQTSCISQRCFAPCYKLYQVFHLVFTELLLQRRRLCQLTAFSDHGRNLKKKIVQEQTLVKKTLIKKR